MKRSDAMSESIYRACTRAIEGHLLDPRSRAILVRAGYAEPAHTRRTWLSKDIES